MISEKELIKGTLEFIKKYNRLPFYKEDDIEIEKKENGEKVLKPYRALKYIKEYHGTQDKFIKYLLDKKILTMKMVSQYTNIKEDRVEELITGKAKSVSNSERRQIHIFFDKDYYEKLGKYSGVNDKCRKECKHPYWVIVDRCSIHSKTNKKKK